MDLQRIQPVPDTADGPSGERAPGPDSPGGHMPLRPGQERLSLQLREEKLSAEKRLVQLGVVRIRRRVITETRTVEVVVMREEMTVERLTVEGSGSDELKDAVDSQMVPALAERLRALQLGETLRLPIVEEEVIIQKRPMVTQELVIDKRLVEEVRRLSDTVRREDARVTHNFNPQLGVGDEARARDDMTARTTAETNATAASEEQAPGAGLQDADRTIQVREEELQVRTQVVEAGAVQVRTGVVSEQESLIVRVEHEETAVEQVAVQPRQADRPIGSGHDIVDIPVYGEQVSLRKQPVVTEEISIAKEAIHDVQQVTATVLREVAHVETQGDVRFARAQGSQEDDDG